MGCDIHLHTEIKLKGKWEHYGAPHIDRNYDLFSKMAGVRSDGCITPIADQKGLPNDVSNVTYLAACWHSADWHSHSWLSAKEILQLEEWLEKAKKDYVPERRWGYLFGNSFGGWSKYPEDYPPEIEDVRFVFWFDN